MQASLLVLSTSVFVTLAFLGLLWMRRQGTGTVLEEDCDWAEDFSATKYRPMARLLSEDDIRFLESQPGFHPSMIRTLRRDRRRVFRSYLRSLRRDFNRLYVTAKQAALYSDPADGLAPAILRQRLAFYQASLLVEVRLALYTAGIGTVDVAPLIAAVEQMFIISSPQTANAY